MLKTFEEQSKFFYKYRMIFYKKGEVILHPTDIFQSIYFLDKGYVESYTLSENGIQFTNLIYKPKEIFPYCWTNIKISNDYYFHAITDVEVYKIPRKEFAEFITSRSDFLLDYYKHLEARTMNMCDRMEQMVFGTAYNKVALRLKYLGKKFGERLNANEMIIPFHLTHEDISNALGLTRETTSIQMKKLEELGYIRHDKLFIILNMKKFNKDKKVIV